MRFFNQKLFKEFELRVLEALGKNSNLLVITLPGLGVTRFIKELVNKNKKVNSKIIITEGEKLANLNFLDLDFDKNSDAIHSADNYFRLAQPDQKFVLILNKPKLTREDNFKSSYSGRHIYSTYYFRARDKEETFFNAEVINDRLNNKQLETIHSWSGGIMRIVKFLAINSSFLSEDLDSVIDSPDFKQLLKPTVKVISETNDEILEKLGIKKDGQFVSKIVSELMQNSDEYRHININLNPDLTFYEDNELSKTRLLKVEKDILEILMDNKGIIAKEQIADIKWGKDSYDEYSDQAIGKTIQRLKKKFNKYTFEVLPEVGYKLVKKS